VTHQHSDECSNLEPSSFESIGSPGSNMLPDMVPGVSNKVLGWIRLSEMLIEHFS